MKVLGLTGSIGMGKSTALAMFAEEGASVWDADAAVHRLYGAGGGAVARLAALAPGSVSAGAVDRSRLRAAILDDPSLLGRVEAAVHPLVAADRDAFLARARTEGAPLAVCDVPLLYETGAEAGFDAVAVVSAPPEIQRARVLARPGMTEAAFDALLAKQLPDAEKRARADHVIDTGAGLDATRARIREVVRALAEPPEIR